MDKPNHFLLLIFPVLTGISCITSLIVLIKYWSTSCVDFNNIYPQVWLVLYIIGCLPGTFLGYVGSFKINKVGLKGAIPWGLFLLFLTVTFIWMVAGYIMLFGYFNCLGNPMANMMLADIVYQTIIFIVGVIVLLCR